MPSYPPRNSAIRKKELLEYKVFEFLRCLESRAAEEKLFSKSEAVKIAMLNYIKSRLKLTNSYAAAEEDNSIIDLRNKLLKDKQEWENMDYNDIKNYCYKTGLE